jgi:hypothetical protein
MSRPLAALLPLLLIAAARLPHAQGTCGATYEVIRGDTLYSIARLCGSSVHAIAAASGLADPRRIETGQALVIPGWRGPEPEKASEDAAPPPRPALTSPPAATQGEDKPEEGDVDDPESGPEGM